MKLTVEPNIVLLDGDASTCERIHQMLSFRDKAAEYQLSRFMKKVEVWLQYGIWRSKYGSEEEYRAWATTRIEELKALLDVYCCSKTDTGLRIPVGLLGRIQEDLTQQNVPFSISDNRTFHLPRKQMGGYCHPLRPPQIDALAAALPNPVATIRMATGVGKTTVGQEIIRHFGVRSIFLVPSRPILHQTVNRFIAAFGGSNVGRYGDGRKKHRHVTVATYASVFHSDPGEFDEYDLVVADECHHVPADTYYEVVENKLRNAVYRYGLTADEERSDGGTILVEAATGPVVFSYDAPQAIKEGYLAQPTFIIYEIGRTEGSYIKWTEDENRNRVPESVLQSEAYTGEDSFPAYKNWILGNDLLTKAVADLAAEFQKEKSVLILIDEKEHGDKLMSYLKQYGAELVTGETPNNEEVMARFNRRELRLIVATSTLGEGADTVPVDVLMNLMGGNKTKQANGRALRNDPDDNGVPRKPTCLIIDFDVPVCPALHRQCENREAVHRTCGPVYRRQLI